MNRTAALAILVLAAGAFADDKPSVLPPKHRAVTIKIEPNDSTGFIIPGSRVDVMDVRKNEAGKLAATLVLQDLLVLAVDVQLKGGKGEKRMDFTVTLAVPEADAAKLALAAKDGKLSLVLRKPE